MMPRNSANESGSCFHRRACWRGGEWQAQKGAKTGDERVWKNVISSSNASRTTHLIEAESATLGKLVDLAVDGGLSFPFPRSPLGSDTCTSLELMAELTPVKRPVPVVGTVDADGGAILLMR